MPDIFEVVKTIPIKDVAEALGIQITTHGQGQSMAVCPLHADHKGQGGEPNLSLIHGINRFQCHKCTEKGSQLDLWMKVTKAPSALEAAKMMAAHWHLSYDEKKPDKPHVKKWKQDKYGIKTWNKDAAQKAHENLLDEVAKPHLDHFLKLRNLSIDYVKAKKIGLVMAFGIDQEKQSDFAFSIPVFDHDGTLLACRLHSRLHRKHKKFVWSGKIEGGSYPKAMYDMTSYNPEGEELWINEGEGDFWTTEHVLKKNAITTLCGAGALSDQLAQDQALLGDLSKKTRIVFCQHNDNTGLKAMGRVRVHMPKDAPCFRIHWPDNYVKKEDVSFWFNTLAKSAAEFEQLLHPYSFEEAEAWLLIEKEKEDAKKKGVNRVYEFGNCYFRLAEGKKAAVFKKVPKKKKDEHEEKDVEDVESDPGPKIEADAEDTKITSFVIRGKATLEIDREGYTRADVETVDGKLEKDVFLAPKTWTSKKEFMERFPHTKYVIQATDRDIQDIMQLVVKTIPDTQVKKGVKYIGMVDHHFVGPKFTISANGVVENGPFEYIPQGSPFDSAVKIYAHENVKDVVKAFCETILRVNKPDVILPTLGWMFACLFKEQIHKIIHYFPILSFFGTSGSGKTSLVQTMLRLYGIGPGFRLFSANATRFSVMRMLSSTNCVPVAVDELKENIGRDVVNFWQQRLKNVYFGETETRGNKDQTISSYEYTAPLIICGEMSILREQAIAERTIAVRPERHYIDSRKDAKEAYVRLDREVAVEAMFPFIVQWLLKEGVDKTKDVWVATKAEIHAMKLPHLSSRVWDNFVVMMFGLNMFEIFAKSMGETFVVPSEMKRDVLTGMTKSLHSVGNRAKIAFDEFLEGASIMANIGLIKKDVNYDMDGELLYLHINSTVPIYRKWAKDVSWEGEVGGRTELYNQACEICKMNQTYVIETRKNRRMGTKVARCVVINLKKAEEMNLDVSGFGFATEEPPAWQQPADPPPQQADLPGTAEPELPPELADQPEREPGADEEEDMFGG